MSSIICCFCADPLSGETGVEIVAPLEDGATQALWAHGVCLSERLHPPVPTLLPGRPSTDSVVFLAVTPEGLQQALRMSLGHPVWCSCTAITEHQFAELKGRNVSRFNYSLDPHEPKVLSDAVATIREHHPGARLWVEGSDEL